MSESTVSTDPLNRQIMIPFVRLDTILSSTEQALARAEASLRKAQQERMRSTSRIRINISALFQLREDPYWQ
jgi:hypothetical protein